jgi:hypothetical protein
VEVAFDEGGDAVDGEEITNKIPKMAEGLKRFRRIEGFEGPKASRIEGFDANQLRYEMCPIDADFKHFRSVEAKEFRQYRKDLSIMRASDLRLTRLFKPIPRRLWHALRYRPGT